MLQGYFLVSPIGEIIEHVKPLKKIMVVEKSGVSFASFGLHELDAIALLV
jgi:hypothetical protein